MDVVTSVSERAAYALMHVCGLRPGEALNVTMDKIDLGSRKRHVANRAATADIPPFTVKSNGQASESKERTVPIRETAIPVLSEAMKKAIWSGGIVAISPQ